MISFLIPTCNFNCSKLVRAIWRQADTLRKESDGGFLFEIIVSDDASNETEVLEKLEKETEGMTDVRILRQERRLGRAGNRNALIAASSMPWKVFMDADAEVDATDFVQRYWKARNLADVVCGSLEAGEKCTGKELRHEYEKRASQITAEEKNRKPYARFTAFNVMMNSKATDTVRFDENCREYGHEDTLFGLDIERAGLTIRHLDNPLIHAGLDSNREFLEKSLTALHTLHHLPQLHDVVGSSRVYRRLHRVGLAPLLRLMAKAFIPPIRRNLLSHHPSLFLFNIYKLLEYSRIK